ncbi:MAG: ATP-binding protein [Ignisphaera sp.]|uniref:ATP-binding protein n=2 Tax=Ignisphaera aggregans TaxID=334771 RepID=A0A7C4JJZ6_9CREN
MSKEYLESLARRYLNEAIINEKTGNRLDAAKNYRKAAEIFTLLGNNYKETVSRSIYKNLAESCSKKAEELERETQIAIAIGDTNGNNIEETVKEFIVTKKPNVKFEDVIGLDNVKQSIVETIIYPYKRPDLFPFGWYKGILLYGPPGCGKTLVVAAIVNEINGVFMYVNAANLMSKWLGESERKVTSMFNYARKVGTSKPVIVFLDEADALLGVYDHEIGGEIRVRNQFLQELDGLADKGEKYFVFVMAATNKPWKLDIGFLRRFQKRIYVPPPDVKARRLLLEYYVKPFRLADDVNLDLLSEITEGYSASDIRDIVLEAYFRTLRELFRSGNIEGQPRSISMQDFLEVLNVRKPSVSKELLKKYEEWAMMYGS